MAQSQSKESIRCRGIKTHNLKAVNVDFEIGKWTAVTGVSGSGKSSLVFDTVYAEAQRRFLETLGTYERQFLQGLPQGEFDLIENVPAAVALKQSNKSSDPRSLVGTASDVFEPLRQVFFSLMDPSCSKCGSPVQVHRSEDLKTYTKNFFSKSKNGRLIFSVPTQLPNENKKRLDTIKSLVLEGYLRIVDEGTFVTLEDAIASGEVSKLNSEVEIVLDRMVGDTETSEVENRLESIWSQVRFSPRFSKIHVAELIDGRTAKPEFFMVQPYCKKCDQHTALIQGSDLDWQSVLGACPTCKGLGNIPVTDPNKVIPNPSLSLEKGAVKPWTTETFEWIQDTLIKVCKANGIKTNVPYESLNDSIKHWIWTGEDQQEQIKKLKKEFVSLKDFFDTLEAERYKRNSRILLAKYRKYVMCPDCEGTRLGNAGRNASAAGKFYKDIMNAEIRETLAWARGFAEKPSAKLTAIFEVYAEAIKKLSLLEKLGLGSSHLARRCKTLSGGEYQRVLLTRVIGNGLTDALYVLDEPSIGLGKSEYPQLIECIQNLRDLGNTVLMVEHEPSLIRAADTWIELGPGGGVEGGRVLESGDAKEPRSFQITANVDPKEGFARRAVDANKFLLSTEAAVQLSGFSMLNCRDLKLEVPLGKLTVIAGPSGAGKSTLVQFGLAAALDLCEGTSKTANEAEDIDAGLGVWKALSLPKQFFEKQVIVSVKQKAMHRTITSVVATVLGLMDDLRKQFASTDDAREFGLTASSFSFNGGGACESCGGRGFVREDLFFLGEVEKECPDCLGRRYRDEVLEISWQGKNINEWLTTNIKECLSPFKNFPKLLHPLLLATRLGLGHLQLGSATSEISGGEAQRLRLCSALSEMDKKVFCILDEPSRGLSEKDVGDLIATLLSFCSQGHTFVIVEHHEQFRKYAHQLVTLGPGAGILGGRIVSRELA